MSEKKTYWTKLRILIVGTFTILSIGTAYYLKAERTQDSNITTHKDIEQRIYPDVQTLQKAIDHDNEVPTDVETYIREQRNIGIGDTLILIGDTLKRYQVEIKESLKIIDSFRKFEKQKKIDDSLVEIIKQISRDDRKIGIDKLNQNMINAVNAINAINQRLDTIN